MKQKTLFLMCGVSGSGKTTWVREQASRQSDTVHISRDEVRFSLVNENEEYFSHEKDVFNEFIKAINEGIKAHSVIYVDATHLNEISRNKVLDRLNLENVNIIPVNFEVNLDDCLIRNSQRTGRANIPNKVIENMYKTFAPAGYGEKYSYKEVWTIQS